jgi:hypothetical protein
MPSALRRLFYSLVSFIPSTLIVASSVYLTRIYRHGQDFSWGHLFIWSVIGVIFASPGWLISLPLVLTVSNIRGWHFWAKLAIGSAIGPIVMSGIALYGRWSHPKSASSESYMFPLLATAISALASLFFLLLLRRAQNQPATALHRSRT